MTPPPLAPLPLRLRPTDAEWRRQPVRCGRDSDDTRIGPEALGSVPANALATASAPTGASAGAASMRVMHFTFEFEGKFFRLEDLLRDIKRLTWTREGDLLIAGRLVTIDGITFDSEGNKVSMAATAYVLPASQGLFAGATPAGPAVTGVTPQAASAPGSATPTPTAAVTP